MAHRRILSPLAAALGAALCASTLLPARTITVDDDGPADFARIQDALNAAVAGDTVSVAAGTYRENLRVRCGVRLVGAGAANTVVDAGRLGSAAVLDGCDAATLMQGFRLTNGLAEVGAGILVRGGAPVITFNAIAGNTAAAVSAGYYGYGGGLALLQSAAVVADNVLEANSADFGGGLHVDDGSARILRNRIAGNSAGIGGGVDAFLGSASAVRISGNTIVSNTAQFGGGIELGGFAAEPVVTNNVIAGNTASGGGAGYGGGIDAYYIDPVLLNNTLSGNSARIGGGLALLTANAATVANNIFHDNRANSGAGAQLDAAAGTSPAVAVTHSVFHLNSRDTCAGSLASLCAEPTNLAADPLLRNPGGGDLRLRPGSPAIDSASAAAPADDRRGQRRPLDGNGDRIAAPDRGAFEYDRFEVLGLRFEGQETMTWDGVDGASAYHVYSGFLSALRRPGGVDMCRDADDPNRGDLIFVETRPPAPGDGHGYIVTAVVDGAEGSAGYDAAGIEKSLAVTCP